MKSFEFTTRKPRWQRALAIVLAVALVLIPVQFPGSARAVDSEQIYPTYIADDFNDAKYTSGVTFKWSMDFAVALSKKVAFS